MFDISKLPLALLNVLRKAAAGDYHRADLDDFESRWHLRDRLPTMSDAEITAYLHKPLPPVDHWFSVAVQCGFIDAETKLLSPLGCAALDMQQTVTDEPANPAQQTERAPQAIGEDEPEAPQYVTLDQMAAHVNRSKRTLERLKTRELNPLPPPDVEGGGGRPDEWVWSKIRPWLEKEFGRQLPLRFPPRI
jgi:hypothetical protein